MSHSPATPSKPIGTFANLTASPTEKSNVASRIMRPSLHEPSPASTYGETNAGDSIPATPQDMNDHGDQGAALLDCLRISSFNDSADRGSGSPYPPRAAKYFVRSEQRSIGRDFESQPVLSPCDKRSSRTVSESLIKQEGLEPEVQSPSWRKPGSFVRSSCRAVEHEDDPFIALHDQAVQVTATNAGVAFKPREDRANIPLTADTAQAMLPPNACVFVANLLQAMSDEQLERSVAAAFARFGRCFAKIRRDSKGMPFAFVQYEHASDAQRAITMGRGLIIEGRACRTEVAKVNRSLYLSKIAGGEIAEAEARQALAPYGAIEKLWYCSQTDKEMFRLPEGVWVMFAFFQDCRDAQAGFRENATYRLEQPKMPEDLRGRLGNRSTTAAFSPTQRYLHSHWETSPQETMQRVTDPVSIFIGNLNPNVTEDMLRELFGRYGRIVDVDVHRRPSASAGPNSFAFIQYYTVDEAKHALNYRYELGGSTLRVEPKESAATLARRETMVSRGSPRNRFQANKETMELLFQHGVSVGIANANASQSPTTASTLYAPYPAYALPGIHQFAPINAPTHLMENEGSPGLHAHSNAYVPQPVQHVIPQGFSQYQVPTIAPAQTTHYIPRPNLAQRTTNYQWPPVDPALPMITKEHVP
ncbi:MAG: hypothetical protein Q9177_000119 [Variospora cf. flavescens]